MIKTVIKRNGEVVDFNKEKIIIAITKANHETEEMTTQDILDAASQVVDSFNTVSVDVETIQDKVEEVLMLNKHTRTAKKYILYREERKKERRRDIFKPRKNLKPYEYPELEAYKEAIQHSYWLHTEYNFTSDIQDYKVNVQPHERTAIKNSMLAIAQVEVDVKEFWGDLYKRLPKPELANVGHTFAESEVRHSDAYAHLLELLGLNSEFEKIDEIPALSKRVNYLKKHNEYSRTGNDRDFAIAVLLFSAFIEHISLFSQFLIIMSFNKYSNLFSGISNVIEATSKEEQLHGEFGVDLINTIREEKPKWFDDEMAEDIYALVNEAYESEHEVLDWIFEDGELTFMPRYTVQEFIKNRLNNSLEAIGLERIFDVDEKEVEKTDWFDDEVVATKHVDFFEKRSVNYTKRSRSITADDLF
ncbi:ribonucleotide-diphosphate reductase subunit beta [Helcococcus kunzii]|uniref:ribonucleotide-diphosphate reductase subunit beta n=1 Tax=Helcococcus kunzii TaxID=40091 RepID=UPI0021A611AE|nr:ribonucleotide-diphosphate reductase subunit beta [Helcococcus kunzii]MCT1796828.1 ribonucleotide-diphosphate reductase subunit beta [Helcococcus kunzii]MCT1988386.1 ribonucleotide-diphosphate reductase subunit beta [Helcococcus kunzii]